MLRIRLLILLLPAVMIYSCGENPIIPEPFYETVYERSGLVDSLRGDCSAPQVRSLSLSSHDLAVYDSLRMHFSNSTDADLAFVEIYYIENFQIKNLMYLQGKSLSEVTFWQIPSPNYSGELTLRMGLKSSICTGHIYHLSMRDLTLSGK